MFHPRFVFQPWDSGDDGLIHGRGWTIYLVFWKKKDNSRYYFLEFPKPKEFKSFWTVQGWCSDVNFH